MSALALRLLAILRPLGSHLSGYAQLGMAAAGEYRAALVRRLCWAAVAIVAGMAGLAATWMIGLVAFWDTRWRLTYVIVSAVVLLLLAIAAAVLALSKTHPGRSAALLREEFNRDRELISEWTRTL